jgi:hypothetical protein
VLSPFVGPRFKTVVPTTDLPMAIDQPIDFGLQDFARSAPRRPRVPVHGDPVRAKVMFNGYEM